MRILRVNLSIEEVSTVPVDLSLVEGFYETGDLVSGCSETR